MLALLAALAVLAACSGRPNVFSETRDARLLRLEEERAALTSATDPVDRTRIQIRISDLMVSFIGDAARTGDMERIEARMADYRTAVLEARDTMMGSGRDPGRDAAGYRDLEIALRQQIGQLDDIAIGLAVPWQEPMQNLITEVTEIRNALLDTIFPG